MPAPSTRGPLPKRNAVRGRGKRGKAAQADEVVVQVATPARPCPEGLEPLATEWFESLTQSGHAAWFEPSDWAFARSIATEYDRYLTSPRPSSEHLKVILEGMARLGTTENDRRRMRIEVKRPRGADEPGKSKPVSEVEEQMRRLAGGG